MTVSFIHGIPSLASYRYRAEAPAKWLEASINDPSADVLVFVKPQECELEHAKRAIADGRRVVVDFQDNRFGRQPHLREFLRLASEITVPTEVTRQIVASMGRDSFVVQESYSYERAEPHCKGDRLFWFGNPVNLHTLQGVLPRIQDYPLTVLCGVPGTLPWSHENMLKGLESDIVILPTTEYHRTANRAVEAIWRGCFVVAEPHSSLAGFPIWVGDMREGIEWAKANPAGANEMTRAAQEYVAKHFAPEVIARQWHNAINVGPMSRLGWRTAA